MHPDAAPGAARGFYVVARAGGQKRRAAAQVLVADAALVSEAEAAAAIAGGVKRRALPEASRAAIAAFEGAGALEFRVTPPRPGRYALWLRARWAPSASTRMQLVVAGESRRVYAKAMIGFSDWTSPRYARTKMFAHFGEQYAHWSWYRIPDVKLPAGPTRLRLEAQAGAAMDALLLLPQTPAMDRAAMNLFMNWSYAPWALPL